MGARGQARGDGAVRGRVPVGRRSVRAAAARGVVRRGLRPDRRLAARALVRRSPPPRDRDARAADDGDARAGTRARRRHPHARRAVRRGARRGRLRRGRRRAAHPRGPADLRGRGSAQDPRPRRVVAGAARAAASARRRRDPQGRRARSRRVRRAARRDRCGTREPRRRDGVRDRIRAWHRRGHRRRVRRDVRQRPDARHGRTRPAGDRGAARARGRVRMRAVFLSAVRTPVGRYGGGLAGTRPDDLAALAVRAAVERAGVPAEQIEDVWLGCANQAGEDNRDVARMAVLLAGLPESIGGVTVNRLCASGLSAIVGAAHAVIAGDGDLFVAGGVESMSRAPLVTAKPDTGFPRGDRVMYDTTLGWRFPNPRMEELVPLETMGETGENVAERWNVTREDQDAFALRSQQRWAAAAEAGRFDDELVPVGELTRDEHPRPDTSLEKLGMLKTVFRDGGTVTAGNASGINDGAAALVIASEERARELGAEPLGAFVGSAVAGVDPRVMGIGPGPAVSKLLSRAGVGVGELDLIELNEAFASQSLVVIRELGLDPERVNVNGGAIALGHPLGMSGARLVVTLLHELRRREGRYGLATLCVGVGQGQAALFERA